MAKANKLHSALQIIIGGQIVAAGLATYIGDEKWYTKVLMPAIQMLGGETSHVLAVKAARFGLTRGPWKPETSPALRSQLWGMKFPNPVGLAAGFDKHGECVDGMSKIGFGFVEVGSVTPLPQPGNAKPRVFRLKEDNAVINRYGFNSEGHEVVHARLQERLKAHPVVEAPDDRNMLNENLWSPDRPTFVGWNYPAPSIVGVNLGKNKESKDGVNDYVQGVKKFSDVADYLVINVSSPNTPGLRDMQGRQQLKELIEKVITTRNSLPSAQQKPLLVKIAPDLTAKDREDVAAVVRETGVDGLIVTNTTITRPESLKSAHKGETGGLSGQPLKEMSTETVREMYRLTQGSVPIVGVGGVANGQDAYEKIRAGASLVQLYTSLSYHGPPLVNKIKKELVTLLKEDGFERISEAVGADHRTKQRKAPAKTS